MSKENTYVYLLSKFVACGSVKDKPKGFEYYISTMFNRICTMFKVNGLPDTIPERIAKLMLFGLGHVICVKEEGKLYILNGNWGGVPNEYFEPTQYTVANPYLKLTKTYTIGKDCVLIRNDSMMEGLLPMFARYSELLVENDITLRQVDIHSRIPFVFSANDENTKLSFEEVMKKYEAGEEAIIKTNDLVFGEGGDLHSNQLVGSSSSGTIKDLIEYEQYLKASWFNEIGLNANYNMKREALNSSESALNDDILSPLIDDILNNWKEGWNKFNEMFGTNVTVELNGVWKNNKIEEDLQIKALNSNENQSNNDNPTTNQNDKSNDSNVNNEGENNE